MTTKDNRVCVFCGGTPLTNEHLYPQWLGKLIAQDPRGFPDGQIPQLWIKDGEEINRWKSDNPLEFTFRTVCASCNSGWMSNIEGAAKPYLEKMITGTSKITLDEKAQYLIANWMGLRTLVARSHHKHPWPAVFYEWFSWYWKKHTLPPRWTVWIGAYNGRLPIYYDRVDMHVDIPPPWDSISTSDINGTMMTAVFGYLAYKVIGLSSGSLKAKNKALVRIAPLEKVEAQWPPTHFINDDTILKFFGMGTKGGNTKLAKYWNEFQKLE